MVNPNMQSSDPNKEAAQELAILESRFRVVCTDILRAHCAEAITRKGTDKLGNDIVFRLEAEPLLGSSFFMEWFSVSPFTGNESYLQVIQVPNDRMAPASADLIKPGELYAMNEIDLPQGDAELLAAAGHPAVYEGKARAEDLQQAIAIMSTAHSIDDFIDIDVDKVGPFPHEVQVKAFNDGIAKYEQEQLYRRWAVRGLYKKPKKE